MSRFFSLSPYTLLLLFQEWILLKDISSLDSVFCNEKDRTSFHHTFHIKSHPEVVHGHNVYNVTMKSSLIAKTWSRRCCYLKIYSRGDSAFHKFERLRELHDITLLDWPDTNFMSFLMPISKVKIGILYTVYTKEQWSYNNSLFGLHICDQSGHFNFGYFEPQIKSYSCCVYRAVDPYGWFTCYGGEWKLNGFDGFAILKFRENGNLYSGEWKYTKQNGQGTMEYRNGDKYIGEWFEGLKSGQGVMKYANGDVYSGQWEKDVKHGFGSLTYITKDTYCGEWVKNQRTGFGTKYYANGDVYKGSWKNGARHGQGSMSYANNEYYTGNWRYDIQHGFGEMQYLSGKVVSGRWLNGSFKGI